MNVKQLREAIAGYDEDTEVLVFNPHRYEMAELNDVDRPEPLRSCWLNARVDAQ